MEGELRVVVSGAEGLPSGADRALPSRIVQAHGGRPEDSLQGMVITLPLPRHS